MLQAVRSFYRAQCVALIDSIKRHLTSESGDLLVEYSPPDAGALTRDSLINIGIGICALQECLCGYVFLECLIQTLSYQHMPCMPVFS